MWKSYRARRFSATTLRPLSAGWAIRRPRIPAARASHRAAAPAHAAQIDLPARPVDPEHRHADRIAEHQALARRRADHRKARLVELETLALVFAAERARRDVALEHAA